MKLISTSPSLIRLESHFETQKSEFSIAENPQIHFFTSKFQFFCDQNFDFVLGTDTADQNRLELQAASDACGIPVEIFKKALQACKSRAKPNRRVLNFLKVMQDGIQDFHQLIAKPHSVDDCDEIGNDVKAQIILEGEFSEDEMRQIRRNWDELEGLIQVCLEESDW